MFSSRQNEVKMARSSRPIAILWDIENCSVPSRVNALDVAVNIRKSLRSHPVTQGHVTVFSAYGDFSKFTQSVREGCQRTGINLIDIPNRGKDAADKAIMVDMLLFALDNPPPCTIVLISGDVDFAPSLHKLGQLGFTFVLAVPATNGVSQALCNACELVWSWPSLASGEGLVPANRPELRSVRNKSVSHSSSAAGSGKMPPRKYPNTKHEVIPQYQENSNKDKSVRHCAGNGSGILDIEKHRHGAYEERGKGMLLVHTQASVSHFAAMSSSNSDGGNQQHCTVGNLALKDDKLSEAQTICTSQEASVGKVLHKVKSSGKGFADKQELYTYAEVVMKAADIQASRPYLYGDNQCKNAAGTTQCKTMPAGPCVDASKDQPAAHEKATNAGGIHDKNQQQQSNNCSVKTSEQLVQDMVATLFNWPSKPNSSTQIQNGISKKKSRNKPKSGTNIIYRNENNVVPSSKPVNCPVPAQPASSGVGVTKSKKKKKKYKPKPPAQCEKQTQNAPGMKKKKKKDGVLESSQTPVPSNNVKNQQSTKGPEPSAALTGKKRKRNSPQENNPMPVEHTKKKKKKFKNKSQNNGA